MKYLLYCRLCWQEFNKTSEHNKGSYYGKERLNGYCPGDIREQVKSIPSIDKDHNDEGDKLFRD